MADDLSVRLYGGPDPAGELDAAGLVALVGALQQLASRVGRHLVDQSRPGRAAGVVERSTRLRLRALRAGSTVLDFVLGEDGVLGEGLEHETTDAMFALFHGLWNEVPPAWATPLIGDAVVELVEALDRCAKACSLGGDRFREVSFRPSSISRSVWPRTSAPREWAEEIEVSGRLDQVDLRRGRFRLRDAVGHDILLTDVRDAAAAAHLVGAEVTVTGEVGRGLGALRVRNAVIVARETPAWSTPGLAADGVDGARTPPDEGLPGLTDDDVAAFLAALGR